MSAFDSNDRDFRDEALWRLLGQARSVEPSPYFSRKVLRAIRAEACPHPSWWESFLQVVAPVGVCAALAVCAVAGIPRGNAPAAAPVANSEIEFETIQNLDLLVSNYESSLWLDPSSPSY